MTGKTKAPFRWAMAMVLTMAPGAVSADALAVPTLVRALESAEYGQRVDFARVAVDELILAYEQVLDQRSMAAPSLGGKTDLRRWRAATGEFLDQLYRVRQRLEEGEDVQLLLGPDGTAVMYVGRQPVLINGPGADDAEPLQRNVALRFCAIHECDALVRVNAHAGSEQQPGRTMDAAHWSFVQDRRPSFVLGHGLRFVYADVRDRARKEQVSRQLAAELQQVAGALRAAMWSGTEIQWAQLRLAARRGGQLERLVLNRGGGGLSVSAPLLARSQALWREALPWLQAQVAGRDYELVLWRADRLLGSGATAREGLPQAIADRR